MTGGAVAGDADCLWPLEFTLLLCFSSTLLLAGLLVRPAWRRRSPFFSQFPSLAPCFQVFREALRPAGEHLTVNTGPAFLDLLISL